MEAIVLKVVQDSAIAGVAIFTIWRMSLIMISQSQALVEIAKMNAETLQEQAEHLK